MALTRIISEIIQDNTIDNADISASLSTSISGSLGANADTIRTLSSTTVSGSFTSVSSSLAARLTSEEGEAEGSVISSSAQIATDISGSRDAVSISGSLGANAGVIRTLSAATVSGSRDAASISGSRDAASISGSFGNQRVGTTNDVKFANITGSNNISASGNINAANITSSGGLNASEIYVDDYIYHNDDPDTYIGFPTGDKVDIKAGNILFIRAWQKDSDIDKLWFNPNQEIVNTRFYTPTNSPGLQISASGDVGVHGIQNPSASLHVGGNLLVDTHITASVNISSSGNIIATGNLDIDGTSNFAGNVTLQNDLTVTGRIDAEEIHTTFISSSIAQATGSNIFGDSINDSHQFTGSLDISGSGTVLKVSDGNVIVSDTLTATNVGAFTAAGAIDFDNQNMTNVDIDSGNIDAVTFGSTTKSMISGSRDAASISGSFGNQRVGTTNDVKFANITGSGNISGSATGSFSYIQLGTAGNIDLNSQDVTIRNLVSNKDLIFIGNDGGTTVEAMRINYSGNNVGVGASSIGAKLHVKDNRNTAYSGTAEPAETMIVQNASGSDGTGVNHFSSLSLQVGDGATSQGFLNYVRTGDNTGDFTFSQRTGGSSYAEHMRIASSGKVGIGTTSNTNGIAGYNPFQLVVEGTSFTGGIGVIEHQNDISGGVIAIGKSRGTATGAVTILQTNDIVGRILFSAADGVDYRTNAAEIRTTVGVSPAANSIQGNLTFMTNDGSGNDSIERMRIDSSGSLSTTSGSAVSYFSNGQSTGSGDATHLIAQDLDEMQKDDSDNTYHRMKALKVTKSGKLRIRWTGRNQSGTYYWSWLISKNGGGTGNLSDITEVSPKPMKLTNGNDASGPFSSGLADGQANATHNYRDFDVSVQGVEPGDQIELWMRSSDGSGGQVTGNGQDLFCKDFKLLSQTPSIVQNPALDFSANSGVSAVVNNASSFILDRYEEGALDVTMGAGSGTITINSSADTLHYTRIGRVVHIQGRLEVASVSTPSGEFTIIGLPYAAHDPGGDAANIIAGIYFENASSSIANNIIGIIADGSTTMAIRISGSTGAGATLADKVDADTNIIISGWYHTQAYES
jgi:hypothetical protein